MPEQKAVEQDLYAIINRDSTTTDKALSLFLWGTKSQLFWDGNKRTSMTAANKILISAGAGMLTISDRHLERFNTLLLNFYNNGEEEPLKQFLYDNCIQGLSI